MFHDQIEVKQKELQPWAAKIDAKQAEIDVATSERDALKKKAEAAKEARENAEAELNQLREDFEAKKAELQELQAEKNRNQRETREAEKELQASAAVHPDSHRYSCPSSTRKVASRDCVLGLPPLARKSKRRDPHRSRVVATTEC